MFFKVLSAMLIADAIDRGARAQQSRYWYLQAPPHHAAITAPVSPQSPSPGRVIAPARTWDPRAPERP
jgi:hypothetical protein